MDMHCFNLSAHNMGDLAMLLLYACIMHQLLSESFKHNVTHIIHSLLASVSHVQLNN